jgi:hypothetical protein
MTNFIKREHDLIAEFQKEMDDYGLEVDNGTSGRCGEGCYHLEMTTKIERAKGKKALIALLLENGYTVNKFMFTDRKTGERYMAFKVYKYATMEDRDDDAEEYVEERPSQEKQKGEWTNTRLLRLKMIEDAREAAYRMNEQYCAGDVGRNHTNCGVLIQALNVLRLLGFEATDATWENGGLLVCESVTVDGERIYTR